VVGLSSAQRRVPAYPEIIPTTVDDPEGVSLARAKLEVLDTAHDLQSHWREIARKIRALRAADVHAT
jgi:hypothetical protein